MPNPPRQTDFELLRILSTGLKILGELGVICSVAALVALMAGSIINPEMMDGGMILGHEWTSIGNAALMMFPVSIGLAILGELLALLLTLAQAAMWIVFRFKEPIESELARKD